MDNNRYCVIMAGGQGTRLWPMSRKAYPKQFQDVLGCGRTLLQQTYDRYSRIVPPENIIISTHVDYTDIVRQQLPGVPDTQVIHEPAFRGTAPSIANIALNTTKSALTYIKSRKRFRLYDNVAVLNSHHKVMLIKYRRRRKIAFLHICQG